MKVKRGKVQLDPFIGLGFKFVHTSQIVGVPVGPVWRLEGSILLHAISTLKMIHTTCKYRTQQTIEHLMLISIIEISI